MKILVIGSGGMLGHMLTYYLSSRNFDVTDVSFSRRCRDESILIDVLSEDFDIYIKSNYFDVIINCAAILPNNCLKDPINAIKINAVFPNHLNTIVNPRTHLIQIGTGGVYKGDHAPYHEDSEQDSTTFYGKTKSLGEIKGENVLLIRSDVVGPDMSRDSRGIFNWILMSENSITGYAHMSINGVTSLEYAKFIEQAINERYVGSYNLHTDGSISKANFIKLVLSVFQKKDTVVTDVYKPVQNNSLSSLRSDIKYKRKSYETQLLELKEWMIANINLYPHYEHLLK